MRSEKETYYDPEKKRTPWLRIILIIGITIVFVVIVILITGAFSTNYDELHNVLVTSAKSYCKLDENNYPEAIGQCITYDLSTLEEKNVIPKQKKFDKCNLEKTTVKICKLSDDEYQYTPYLSCDKYETKYGEWQAGKIDDLKQGISDIEIKFLAEQGKVGTKNYYPNNEEDDKKVSEYYDSAPTDEYIYKDSQEVAYKWYVGKDSKVYYNNGATSATEPDGYPLHENEVKNKYASITKPAQASYRTISSGTLYATETVAYPFRYVCTDSSIPNARVISGTICENRNTNTFKTTSEVKYTCDGSNEVSSETICQGRSKWSLSSCENGNQIKKGTTSDGYGYSRNELSGITCIKASGYIITDKAWKWYKNDKVNAYYPDDADSPDNEKTYYTNTPTAGAIKDENTKNNVYKYYKIVSTDHDSNIWLSLTDESLTEEDLINKYKELGYDVNSLDDIENNNEIQYQIEISYRDRK